MARFVEPESSDEPVPSDFYEYLVGHEIYLEDGRTFHICTAQALARDALERGRIRHDFQCPVATEACPLRALLAERPGHDCLLRLGKRPEEGAR